MNTKPEPEELEWIRRTVEISAAKAAAARVDFTETVAKYGIAYAIEWGDQQVIDEFTATRWAIIAGRDSDGDFLDALAGVVEQTHRELVENSSRPTSSSALTNAVRISQTEAAARFYRDANSMLEHLRNKGMFDRCPSCACYFIEAPENDECPVPEQHTGRLAPAQHGTSISEAN